MCFYKDPRHWEVKTATRDMICYKGIRVYPETEDLYAVYHLNYKYTLNKLLRSRLDRDGMRFVYCGFHSFSSKKAAELRKREWREQFTSTSLYIKIFVCIIPAGSNYFGIQIEESMFLID